MDNRLQQADGLRPQRLTRREVPALARALVAVIRRQADVDRHLIGDTPCIRIVNLGAGVNVLVRSDDWQKLVPYLKDGTLDVSQLPVARPVVLNPRVSRDASVVDVWDSELYGRVVALLETLFKVGFPVSDL